MRVRGRWLPIAALLATTHPASAQIWDGGGRRVPSPMLVERSVGDRILNDVNRTIADARRAGDLSRGDARALRRESREIETLYERYAAGGLSGAENAELDARVAALRGRVDARRSADGGAKR